MIDLLTDPNVVWALLLAVVLPMLIIAAGELDERLRQRDSAFRSVVNILRVAILPLLAVWILAATLFEIDNTDFSLRLIASGLLLSLTAAGLAIAKILIGWVRDRPIPEGGRAIPQLLLLVPRMVIVLIAALFGVFVSRRITRPLERLSSAVRKIGTGDFDVNVAINSSDEIGELSDSFNEMASELKERESSLKSAQQALVQSEKMAAVGTLSAGLAHEVKNPLSAVLGYAQLSMRKLDQPEALKKNLGIIENETRRCNEIISNLMQFSRQEKGELSRISVNEVIKKSIKIVDHQLSLKNVRIESDLADTIALISGNANQLQQVLMNLMINAQQAIGDEGGTVSLATISTGESVIITVSDTGPGMDDEVAAKIFEPFFTTKPAGQGTGLGLSVTYGIIQDHGGDISVTRADSGGAKFTITLPLENEEAIALEHAS